MCPAMSRTCQLLQAVGASHRATWSVSERKLAASRSSTVSRLSLAAKLSAFHWSDMTAPVGTAIGERLSREQRRDVHEDAVVGDPVTPEPDGGGHRNPRSPRAVLAGVGYQRTDAA